MERRNINNTNVSTGRNPDNNYGFNRGFKREDLEGSFEIDNRGMEMGAVEEGNPPSEDSTDEDEQYLAEDRDNRNAEQYRDI